MKIDFGAGHSFTFDRHISHNCLSNAIRKWIGHMADRSQPFRFGWGGLCLEVRLLLKCHPFGQIEKKKLKLPFDLSANYICRHFIQKWIPANFSPSKKKQTLWHFEWQHTQKFRLLARTALVPFIEKRWPNVGQWEYTWPEKVNSSSFLVASLSASLLCQYSHSWLGPFCFAHLWWVATSFNWQMSSIPAAIKKYVCLFERATHTDTYSLTHSNKNTNIWVSGVCYTLDVQKGFSCKEIFRIFFRFGGKWDKKNGKNFWFV